MEQRPMQFDFFESDSVRNIKIQVSNLKDDPKRLNALNKDVCKALQQAEKSNKRLRESMHVPRELWNRRFGLRVAA